MKKQELEGRPGKPENLTVTMHPISPAESPKLLVIGDIRYVLSEAGVKMTTDPEKLGM